VDDLLFSLAPTLGAGGEEELRLNADQVGMDDERTFFRADENPDSVIVVVARQCVSTGWLALRERGHLPGRLEWAIIVVSVVVVFARTFGWC
jgi:hypothetical protein